MTELLRSPKLFPSLMVLLSALAAIRYGIAGDIRHTIYWVASATIIASVTY